MQEYRWSVRNLDPEVLNFLREVKEESGLGYGELVSAAIVDWFENIPEEEPFVETPSASEDSSLVHQVSENYGHGQ